MNPKCLCFIACLVGSAALCEEGVEKVEEVKAVEEVEKEIGLESTRPLEMSGDIASRLVGGVDRFLLTKITASRARRKSYWIRDLSSVEAYRKSIAANRQRLAHIAGIRDERVAEPVLELVATTDQPARVGAGDGYDVYAVRWRVLGDVYGEGLLLEPHEDALAQIIALPDADLLPEQITGLVAGLHPTSQYARRLAESGCRVIVPVLVDRGRGKFRWGPNRESKLTHREFLYRSGFELGRGLIGYELQKVLALVDLFKKQDADKKIAVAGWGEGGLLALYAAALDERIDAALVSGYFDDRRGNWSQPIDRNVFGILERFGDADLATLIAPRSLVVEASLHPEVKYGSEGGGAPASIVTPDPATVKAEIDRARSLLEGLEDIRSIQLSVSGEGKGPFGGAEALQAFLVELGIPMLQDLKNAPQHLRASFLPDERLHRAMRQIDRHNQWLLRQSSTLRKKFILDKLDTENEEAYSKSAEPFRKFFAEEVIGRFDCELLPPRPRAREFARAESHVTYEVVLDVFPDVMAYGLLLVPNDIDKGAKRPVVVCQHGLEGRPQSTIGEKDAQYYDMFATRLAQLGYVTFAPQNLYIFGDRFRSLQRKANGIKKTLFSIMVPQHQQIVDWLQTLSFVDPNRIAFYGLSYGGKSAMRIPPLVTDYCLSICSGDFNEWVDKNASTTNPRSYVWTSEYEIFEFDLGSTFNYAEMAALIAPRPFMVERGHFDGVGDDWTVASEFAKVRHLYAARLGMADRCEIEWFAGPHKINGKGTFAFLERHLGPIK